MILLILLLLPKKVQREQYFCKSEQRGKFLVSLTTFIALSQVRVIDHK